MELADDPALEASFFRSEPFYAPRRLSRQALPSELGIGGAVVAEAKRSGKDRVVVASGAWTTTSASTTSTVP